MGDPDDTKSKKSILNHPLTNIVVGFILTGILGTALTEYFMLRRDQIHWRQEAVTKHKEAIKGLSHLMANRNLHAELLIEAFEVGASDEEINDLRAKHRAAYSAWQTDRANLMLLARDVLSDEHYRQLNEYVEVHLVERLFDPLRDCILNAYVESKDRKAALTVMERCNANELVKNSINCSSAIIHGLYVFADSDAGQSDSTARSVSEAKEDIEQSCS